MEIRKKEQMKVQDIFIYPVKSLAGIRKLECRALQRGFERDRRWMLVDDSGKFITQRVEHSLALLKTEMIGNTTQVSYKYAPEKKIILNFDDTDGRHATVTVWNDDVTAFHLSDEADEWFSTYLEKPCKLFFMEENVLRPVDENYAENNEQVSFADAFPYLLISQASLDDLNSRLADPVPMNRFRPNLVVSGTEAFDEDTWAEIKIGDVHFKVAKPCARCILTTVDQETGKRGSEPLRTLSGYRSTGNKVLFGQNLIALNEGFIRENDPVKIIHYK